jgi:hypothetical protein
MIRIAITQAAFDAIDNRNRMCNLSVVTTERAFVARPPTHRRRHAMTFVKRIADGTAIGAVMLIGLSAPPAQAAYVVTLTQEVIGGVPEVVANGSGTIDLTDLTLGCGPACGSNVGFTLPQDDPTQIVTGSGEYSEYDGVTGPTSFGGFELTYANSNSGPIVSVIADPAARIDVPDGYVSGHPLSDTSTFDNATFASLGVTPGTYEWTWGTGAHADSFTLDIVAATVVPEPSTWAMMLLGFAGLGFAGWRCRRWSVSREEARQ